MKTISCDIETFSSVDLAKAGVYKYAESPDFEILLFGYSVDGGDVRVVDLAAGETIPAEVLDALTDDSVIKTAHNSNFERVCLSRYLSDLGISLDPFNDSHPLSTECARFLNPAGWHCTMIWAAYMGLPLSLADTGAVLGLEKQKLSEGKDLIRYFCKPCEPTKTNGGRTRNRPADAPDKWALFKSYNLRDVETELEIEKRLSKFPVPEDVWDQYHIDQEINDRGIAIDDALVENAIRMDARSRAELTEMMQKLTNLDNPNSVQQMKQWLINNGMEIDSLGKKQVQALLQDAPPQLREVLLLRQQLAKSSVKKYIAMKNAVCDDGRVRGMFQFYGAVRSGRWAGRLVQLQNLYRNSMPDLEAARNLVREGDYNTVKMLYGAVPDVLAELVRTAFIPRAGQKFIVSDFSAVEARVIAWLAGEQWRMDVFRDGGDIYCASASQMFKVPVEKHGVNGQLRQKGKIAELALGYGGSVGALKAMGALDMGLSEDELAPLVKAWRESNPNIVRLWWAVDDAVMKAIRNKTTTQTHGITFTVRSGMLFICRIIDGPTFDPISFLSAYPDWQDCSRLPVSSREKQVRVSEGKKQEDPLSKQGIVGIFCRAYTVQDAIYKFLSDVYAPSVKEGRFDYIPGEGTAGVVIYDDKFAYSHHATDPAGGKLLNAFDLVRLHRFPEEDEKTSFLKMCAFAETDELVKEAVERERLAEAQKDFEETSSSWEEPLPFGRHTIVPFPLDALPPDIRNYVAAISESVQTPVDMAGCAALSVIATSVQGKFAIRGKPDWTEPLNIYLTEIAPPSERKSAIQHAMVRPVSDYENRYNQINAAAVESSRMHRRILERRQKAVEDQVAKGKAEQADVDDIARELTAYEEQQPLRLFADDITPEKLASVLAENDGRMALLSSEAGIFDTLAGAYSKSVNIDVMLKSYSGDQIRVDRIGRESENILNPTLTVLLMAQPNVISRVLSNETFRGRGLTARFLYCMPASAVGGRRYRSEPVPDAVYAAYERCVFNMLEDDYGSAPEIITLSPEADALMEAFSQELEPKLVKEYAEIADWCGKLAGNTLRIAGLLCRAATHRGHDFLDVAEPLVVDGQTMANAIRLGKYFLNHAQAIFNVLPENAMFQNAHRILKMIYEKGLKEFNRRTAMRNCQTFKRVEEIQPVLDFLEDYGYIAPVEAPPTFGKGRPAMPKYIVNPWVEQYYCHTVMGTVIPSTDTIIT